MASFYDDNEDLRWYVDTGIDWAPLIELTERRFADADGPQRLDLSIDEEVVATEAPMISPLCQSRR